ncbi:MAG TPA: sugar porter family MFS transporter [Rhizomicrobium sp.]|jgi:sugar porter (SP) family MFS transporter|nr:sugar porter family MFS transporter [Rhizomicrobium sp.]
MNSIVIRGVLVGALAGLLFGFDTAVIAGTTQGLKSVYQLSPEGLGITVSSALWGTLAGALLAGVPGDRYGARQCLKAIAVLYIISSAGCALAWSWSALLVFRVMAGLAIGASTVLAPVYLTEIAPPKWRGAMVGMFQFNIVVGILVAYLCNYLIGGLQLGADEWRWKFSLAVLPGFILITLLFTIPQSPRWLALKGRIAEAKQILHDIAPDIGSAEENAILLHEPAEDGKLSWAKYKKPILLAFAIAAFNQLAGINAILYYINDIFASAGFSKVSADQQAIAIGATNFLFTLPALYLIDRIGRKTLLLIGSVGLFATLSGTAAILISGQHQDLLLWMLIGFIGSFAFSQGAVIWVYISEIFPTEVRARGQSIGSSTHWGMDAIIATLFPIVAAYSKGAPFIFFAVMVVLQFIVVLFFFPETKRAPLENISAIVTTS